LTEFLFTLIKIFSMRSIYFKLLPAVSFMICSFISFAQNASGYRLVKTFHIASGGGWDYISVNDRKLYVSHATQVNILDQSTGDSLGVIPNTTGIHGIAFVSALGKGYTSNGRLNTLTVFDLKTNGVIKQIPVGQNPDAIFYDPFSRMIISCNGRSHDLSVVDPQTDTLVSTIALSGKPETAVSDESGRVYVNIEDKNAISVIDIAKRKVLQTWSIAPGEGPTGLAIDIRTKRLFAGCEKLLMVIDASTGKMVSGLPIGEGCDGVAFDSTYKYVFASCGEGTVSIAKEDEEGGCSIIDQVATKRSARTLALDTRTHELFLPAADFGTAPAGQRPPVIPGTFQVLVLSK
jgi:YVTN family beta-propeller protein